MKLFNSKDDKLYLSKTQWSKIFFALTWMMLLLYTIAMICSLCGSKYFIVNYQNQQLDNIEKFLTEYKILPLLNWIFTTIEFCIIISFILKKFPKWYYVLTFYAIAMIVSATLPQTPIIFYQIYPFAFYLIIPIIEQLIFDKRVDIKVYSFSLLRLIFATVVSYLLQVMLYAIKNGNFSFNNNIQTISSAFIYAIEYDIALSIMLFSALLFYKEKGDSNLWETFLKVGGFSRTSKKQSQTLSSRKNLTKTQISKIRRLYIRVYLTQLGAFLLLMVLPFLLGKVFEFLVMYFAFAIVRYILGFNYSLHYKKETTCITVGAVVFGILALAVPFFTVVIIIAILLGVGLAILLHLSYRYKGMFLFSQISKPDKFALLYTYFDGNIESIYVKKMCVHKGLNQLQIEIIVDFIEGNKISYIAHKYNYSQRMIIYKLDEAIDKLIH
ncbi:MAG: accessory gene regulator B family protein [Bacilli bacterium]|nr:accessory gene regulator B family protein [Bacilli bacterium]